MHVTRGTARLCYAGSLARAHVVSPPSPDVSRSSSCFWRLKLSRDPVRCMRACVSDLWGARASKSARKSTTKKLRPSARALRTPSLSCSTKPETITKTQSKTQARQPRSSRRGTMGDVVRRQRAQQPDPTDEDPLVNYNPQAADCRKCVTADET